jgi:hypothetical protein
MPYIEKKDIVPTISSTTSFYDHVVKSSKNDPDKLAVNPLTS